MDESRRSTTIRLPDEIMEWLKIEAYRRRTSVNALIEQIVTKAKESTA